MLGDFAVCLYWLLCGFCVRAITGIKSALQEQPHEDYGPIMASDSAANFGDRLAQILFLIYVLVGTVFFPVWLSRRVQQWCCSPRRIHHVVKSPPVISVPEPTRSVVYLKTPKGAKLHLYATCDTIAHVSDSDLQRLNLCYHCLRARAQEDTSERPHPDDSLSSDE